MSKDATPTAANQTGDAVVTRVVRRRPCIYTLLTGAILGLLVGILNFAALYNHWELQDDFFDIVDAPISPLFTPRDIHRSLDWFILFYGSAGPRSWKNSYGFRVALGLICYWAIIGVFLASLFHFVRNGVICDITRDKICRCILFFGTCIGLCIGSLSFLAASNRWQNLDNSFDFFDQPVESTMDALRHRYDIPASSPWLSQSEFIWWHSAAVVYWAVIGFFVASLFCVFRVLKSRKKAIDSRATATE